jgi:methionyl-tRNA formyltransferase
MPLKLVFMGTADFAVPTLARLAAAGHKELAVYTQPPRPRGRGQKPQDSPVAAWARQAGLTVRHPASLRDKAEQSALKALRPDAAVVVAYGLLLPDAILAAPRLGCFNVHGSLLPRWRGAAPIQRAILAGDSETGVTIMQLDAGLDTGPVLAQRRVAIGATTTATTLTSELAAIGADLMVEALAGIASGSLAPTPQPPTGATYAAKITKDEGRIDWRRTADELDRTVRALNPSPGVWFETDGERIKVLAATPIAGTGLPGVVIDESLTVACGKGALSLARLQRPGRAPLTASEFLRGFPLPRGTRLG